MQNIQDLKEKIFFESRNIIDILEKINNVDELLSKQDLVDELANRISFLRLLEKNIEYFVIDNSQQNSENQFINDSNSDMLESGNEVTEEEAIFNNEFNEIDENSENIGDLSFSNGITEEEAIFNNQLNEIVEGEFHESFVNLVEESSANEIVENTDKSDSYTEEGEAVFMSQLNEIDENEPTDYQENILSFVDEERILANAEPENDDDIHEDMFVNELTEEEAIFNNQLNEIDEFENEISDYQGNKQSFEEEEKIQDNFESEVKSTEYVETIPSIFDTEILEDEEILVEENEEQFVTSHVAIEQGEMMTDTSNVENVVNEIKSEVQEEKHEDAIMSEETMDRRKIVDIDRPLPETEKDKPASDESFENLDAYQQERKIRLANIKGLKAVQTLFDDDPLEREIPKEEKPEPVVKEETGSILKTNIPTDYMEAEKTKPEFRLDLNDRIAFSKMLFGGSQSELNEVVGVLNSFKTLDQAKEYLSELYYEKNWKKVDEYAQRLWVLVENKFL